MFHEDGEPGEVVFTRGDDGRVSELAYRNDDADSILKRPVAR